MSLYYLLLAGIFALFFAVDIILHRRLAGEFTASDFLLTDTQYDIEKFTLLSSEQADNVSIALAVDCSGSMSGTTIANARLAAGSSAARASEC